MSICTLGSFFHPTLTPKAEEVVSEPVPKDDVVEAKFKGKMNYAYGDNFDPDVTTAETTLEAIKRGDRTATTRYESEGNMDYWKDAQVGDIVEFSDNKGNTVLVEVTKPFEKLIDKGINANEWVSLEGWSLDYYLNKVVPKINEAWQMEFKLLEQTEEYPFISEEAAALVKQIPTSLNVGQYYDQLINAAHNMDTEKFNSIVEQMKNCTNG